MRAKRELKRAKEEIKGTSFGAKALLVLVFGYG